MVRLAEPFSNPEIRQTLAKLSEHLGRHSKSAPTAAQDQPPAPRTQLQLRPDQVDELAAQYQAGATLKEVGAHFGITAQTAARHLERRGISRRQPRSMSPAEISQAYQLYQDGLSLIAIGKQIGYSPNTVKKGIQLVAQESWPP